MCVFSLQVSPLLWDRKRRETRLWLRSYRWAQPRSAAAQTDVTPDLCLTAAGQPCSVSRGPDALSKEPRFQDVSLSLPSAFSWLCLGYLGNNPFHTHTHQPCPHLSTNWRGGPSLLRRPPGCFGGVDAVQHQHQGQSLVQAWPCDLYCSVLIGRRWLIQMMMKR